ncbi:site-specific DNA-methyltransferase [Furfurilactobacillus entadae]|uniref:site-specific DNA-methyltransferase n=1 Tax=Furfurilactobacillus entadae TaxID=2922307 RepID=UPI0035EC6847
MLRDNADFNKHVNSNSAFMAELQEKLPAYFVPETVDDDGNVTAPGGFDLEKFKQSLKESNVNELSSGYQLDFIGKNYAKKQAGERPETVIVADTKHNAKTENKDSKNLFFTGDNLEVLRHLQNAYANAVDFIYIDPPYNTGTDGFVYPDYFEYDDAKLQEMFGLNDDELSRLKSIQGKATHSAWLAFMYPRLYLAKKLLKDSGLIFISIDDNEQANLKLLMDEIFGEGSFKNVLAVRRGAKSVQAQFETWDKLGQDYEYVLLYAKDGNSRFPAQFKKLTDKREGTWNNHWRGTDRPTMRYALFGITPERGQWRWSKERSDKGAENYQQLLQDLGATTSDITNEQIDTWIKKQDQPVDLLRLSSTGKPEHYIPATDETLLNSNWTDLLIGNSSELRKLFGFVPFDTPKLVAPIERMLKFVPKDALVLDFFAGSATTADAVMQLNKADGGQRHYILAQLPEPLQDDSVAAKAGYKTIDEISCARIEKAADAIGDATGFKHYHVVQPNVDSLDEIEFHDDIELNLFDDMITPFSSARLGVPGGSAGNETILNTWLLADGYTFDTPIKTRQFGHASVAYVNDSRIYIINKDWNTDATKALVNEIGTNQLTVQSVVVYGYELAMEHRRELELALKQLDVSVNLQVRY